MLGMPVRVVSGDHEGRAGVIAHLDYPRASYTDPELYAVVKYSERDEDGKERYDEIALPVRRLEKR
jgi:hypothetical protein